MRAKQAAPTPCGSAHRAEGRAVPTPPADIEIDAPGQGFAFHWSVVRWFAGGVVAEADLQEDLELASALAAFVRALHPQRRRGRPAQCRLGGAVRPNSRRRNDRAAR